MDAILGNYMYTTCTSGCHGSNRQIVMRTHKHCIKRRCMRVCSFWDAVPRHLCFDAHVITTLLCHALTLKWECKYCYSHGLLIAVSPHTKLVCLVSKWPPAHWCNLHARCDVICSHVHTERLCLT